jgi:serine/threonine protein kinase
LEQGEPNLSEAISSENLTSNPLSVYSVLFDIAICLHHTHSEDYVHGDVKPKKTVLRADTRNWNLIDFDGAVGIGRLGLKVSTAYMPPETLTIVRGKPIMLTKCNESNWSIESHPSLSADPSFDAWAFGVVMYQLIAEKIHLLEGVDAYDDLDERG